MTEVSEVLMLTNAVAPDKLGGLERYVRELSAALVATGVPVTVLTKRVGPGDAPCETGGDGVRIVRHAVPSKSDPTFALQYPVRVAHGVRSGVRHAGPGVVVHGHYAITSLPVALSRTPYVYTFHAPVHKEMLSERGGSYVLPAFAQGAAVRGLRSAERRVVRTASRNVVLSEFMRAQLGELSTPAGTSSAVVPGGIDTDHFCPGRAGRDDWAAGGHPLLFTARRLTLRTGVLELVQAMPRILERHPSARLAIAGEGHHRPVIEREIADRGLGGSVRLLGRIDDADLLHWYRAADLSVTPTQHLEGFGLATGEALAVGTPALVTPVGANAELVRDLDPLLVASGCTPEDLASSVVRLVDRPGALAGLRCHARAHAHPRWAWSTVAATYLDLYREHLGR